MNFTIPRALKTFVSTYASLTIWIREISFEVLNLFYSLNLNHWVFSDEIAGNELLFYFSENLTGNKWYITGK